MDAYDEVRGQYLSPQQAEYTVKKYKPHRSVRECITAEDMVEVENRDV